MNPQDILDKARKANDLQAICNCCRAYTKWSYLKASSPDKMIPFCEEFIRMKERLMELESPNKILVNKVEAASDDTTIRYFARVHVPATSPGGHSVTYDVEIDHE